jgi:hypothetical protein
MKVESMNIVEDGGGQENPQDCFDIRSHISTKKSTLSIKLSKKPQRRTKIFNFS